MDQSLPPKPSSRAAPHDMDQLDQIISFVRNLKEENVGSVRSRSAHRNNLGKVLRTERKAQGITMEELAALSGVSKGVVQRLENNWKVVSIGCLYAVCEALGLSLLVDVENSEP